MEFLLHFPPESLYFLEKPNQASILKKPNGNIDHITKKNLNIDFNIAKNTSFHKNNTNSIANTMTSTIGPFLPNDIFFCVSVRIIPFISAL